MRFNPFTEKFLVNAFLIVLSTPNENGKSAKPLLLKSRYQIFMLFSLQM